MPGRAFIGLSPGEKHRAEFETSPLPDEPQITVWLVAGAVLVALVVVLIGWQFHQPMLHPLKPIRGLCGRYGTLPDAEGMCPRPGLTWLNRISMTVWFVYAALAAALVMVTPFLIYRAKRSTGQA